jgi:hypothetical protein
MTAVEQYFVRDEEVDLGKIITGPNMTKASDLDLSGLSEVGRILLANSSYRFQRSIGIACGADERTESQVSQSIRAEPLDPTGDVCGYRLFARNTEALLFKEIYENFKEFSEPSGEISSACPQFRPP